MMSKRRLRVHPPRMLLKFFSFFCLSQFLGPPFMRALRTLGNIIPPAIFDLSFSLGIQWIINLAGLFTFLADDEKSNGRVRIIDKCMTDSGAGRKSNSVTRIQAM